MVELVKQTPQISPSTVHRILTLIRLALASSSERVGIPLTESASVGDFQLGRVYSEV